jgi:hypothetical protein
MRHLLLPLVFVLAGCGDDLFAPPDNAVGRFLRGEGITRINSLRDVVTIPGQPVAVFEVQFGKQDCESGCFPYTVHGLRYESRVGWLTRNTRPVRPAAVFDFRPTDDFLFSAAFIEAVVPADLWIGWLLIELMADDPDTPLHGLLNLIDALRHTAIPQVAQHLLDNPTVRTSRVALEALANIEDTAHANFTTIRAEAARLLAELDA